MRRYFVFQTPSACLDLTKENGIGNAVDQTGAEKSSGAL
jgi:hypothetical protein